MGSHLSQRVTLVTHMRHRKARKFPDPTWRRWDPGGVAVGLSRPSGIASIIMTPDVSQMTPDVSKRHNIGVH